MSLRHGAVLNLAGQVIPAISALVAIPIIQSRLGDAQLGILVLGWAAIGYFGLFDLGFRRALTHGVAVRVHAGRIEGLSPLVWTTWWSMAGVGLIGSVALLAAEPWVLARVVTEDTGVAFGSRLALWSVALAFPWVAVSSGSRGVLEGFRRFDLMNAVRIPVGLATYLGPAIATYFSSSVVPALIVLALTRVAGAIAGLSVVLYSSPPLRRVSRWRADAGRELMTTGGSMTVANLAGSSMVYLDRFVVGALTPLASVAYYTTPQEMLGKLLAIPAAISSAAFPAFSGFSQGAPDRLARAFERTTGAMVLALFVPTLTLAALGPELLALWIGEVFAAESAHIVVWLAAGTLMNGVAAAPFALLQATGRSRLTAILQVAELPIYTAVLWWMTSRYGIEGAAASWTLRVTVDASLLFGATWRELQPGPRRRTLGLVAAAGMAVPLTATLGPLPARLAILVVASVGTVYLVRPVLGLDVISLFRSLRPGR